MRSLAGFGEGVGMRRLSRGAALAACLLPTMGVLPAQALAAGKPPVRPTFTVPASARAHGNSNQTTTVSPQGSTPVETAPAGTTPTSTTPTTPTISTPATSTPNGAATQPSTTTPAATTPLGAATSAKPLTTQTKHAGGTRLSSGAIALIALGALLLLGCIAWAILRQLALEPRWSVSLMHSLREASYRGSATWAEFTDWSRLGR